MTVILDSWPWYDRAVVGAAVVGGLLFCAAILRKLDRIVQLLEGEQKQ